MARERWTRQLQPNPCFGLSLWRCAEQGNVAKTEPPLLLWVGRYHYCMKTAWRGVRALPWKDEVFSSGKRSVKITGAPFPPPVHIIYLLILTSQLTLWPICGVGVNRQNEHKASVYCDIWEVWHFFDSIQPRVWHGMTNGGLLPFVLTYVFTTVLRNGRKSIQLGFDPEKYLTRTFSFVLHYRIDSNFIWCFCFSIQQQKEWYFRVN